MPASRIWHVALLGRTGSGRPAAVAEEVEPVHRAARLLAEPALDVDDRLLPVAQRTLLSSRTGQLDRGRHQRDLQRVEGGRTRHDPQPHAGLVRAGWLATGVEQAVVDLHRDQTAGVQRESRARGEHRFPTSGRPRADPRRARLKLPERPVAGTDAGAAEAGPAIAGSGGIEPAGILDILRFDPEEDGVVDDGRVLRQELAAGDEDPLGELRIHQEAPVLVGAAVGRLRRVRPRHGETDEPFALAQWHRTGGGLRMSAMRAGSRRLHRPGVAGACRETRGDDNDCGGSDDARGTHPHAATVHRKPQRRVRTFGGQVADCDDTLRVVINSVGMWSRKYATPRRAHGPSRRL